MPIEPHHWIALRRAAVYRGDGSERCLVCGWREYPSWYVGQTGRLTDEGLPERFPVCSEEHAAMWMRKVWLDALADELDVEELPY